MNINLYLVRHGQSVANLDHTEYMRTDDSLIELTPVGKKQCVLVAKDLNLTLKTNDQTVVLCSSPYARAISSAEIIQSHLNFNADIHIVDTLKERKLGSLVSEIDWSVTLTPKEIAENPKLHWNYRPKNGESYADTYARAQQFYNDLVGSCMQHKISHVIVVSHYVFLQTLIMVLDDLPQEDWPFMEPIDNAEIIFKTIGK
jgi:broad specificity phosphatase PhoE